MTEFIKRLLFSPRILLNIFQMYLHRNSETSIFQQINFMPWSKAFHESRKIEEIVRLFLRINITNGLLGWEICSHHFLTCIYFNTKGWYFEYKHWLLCIIEALNNRIKVQFYKTAINDVFLIANASPSGSRSIP